MCTPHKRIRLDLNDPSIPMQDESPFLEANNDVIDAIFCRLTNQKFKMRMGLVCEKLKSRSSARSAWHTPGDKILHFGQDGQVIMINGNEFTHEQAHTALDRLLERVIVEDFQFFDVPELTAEVFLALCRTISHHKEFINLKFVRISSFTAGVDYDPLITSLVHCGLGNVSFLELGHRDLIQYLEFIPHSIFPLISAFSQLKSLYLSVQAMSDHWELFMESFVNYKLITTINIDSVIDVEPEQAVQFAQICSTNCPKLTSLVFVCQLIIENFQPLAFTNGLGNLCSNITHFGIKLDPRAESHCDFVTTVCDLFPKLASLEIHAYQGFPSEFVLQSIGNIFDNYIRPGPKIYQFKLAIDVEKWGKVVHNLAEIKWKENDEFVEIFAKNRIWHCIKNNVVIKLTLRTEEFDSDSESDSSDDDGD